MKINDEKEIIIYDNSYKFVALDCGWYIQLKHHDIKLTLQQFDEVKNKNKSFYERYIHSRIKQIKSTKNGYIIRWHNWINVLTLMKELNDEQKQKLKIFCDSIKGNKGKFTNKTNF